MHRLKFFSMFLVLSCCLFNGSLAQAQSTNPLTSGASKNSQAKSDSSKKTPTKPISESPLQAPELLIAERVHVGQLPCELGASIHLSADAHSPGYFNLQGKGYKYRMHPVSTSTGAIRLEDEKAGAVWLQLANKSMLMDQKNGRRLADECAHPNQVAVANDMKINPPPALIDVSNLLTSNQR